MVSHAASEIHSRERMCTCACVWVCHLSMTTKYYHLLSEWQLKIMSLRVWENPSKLLGEIIKYQDLTVPLRNDDFYRQLKHRPLLAVQQWGEGGGSIEPSGKHKAYFLLGVCSVVLGSCRYLESSCLGLGTRDFCLNLKIFKI